jgi:homogentisate 1,2-dioxygenase
MQQVRRDTIKTVRHNKVNLDTMSWDVDTTLVNANKESYEAVISGAYVHPKPEIVLTAFDTIQPCDVSLLAAPTYYTAKPQPVRNTQDLEMPMNYDILLNGVVFSFTLWLSAKYLMGCGAAWRSLIADLRNV